MARDRQRRYRSRLRGPVPLKGGGEGGGRMAVQNGPKPLLPMRLGFWCIWKVMNWIQKYAVTSFWCPIAMETIQDGRQTII